MHARSWKWFHYYWRFAQYLGKECYQTWRREVLASVVIGYFLAVLTTNWKDFKTALLATGSALGCFVIWHALRVPWIVHKSVHGESEKELGFLAGAFGIIVILATLVGGCELGLTLWNVKPACLITSVFQIDPGASNAEIADLKIKLAAAEKTKKPPVLVQHDPVIDQILKSQQDQIAQLRTQFPCPKKKALELSNEIIKYATDAIKDMPLPTMVGATTKEESARRFQHDIAEEERWQNQLNAGFQYQFARRIADLQEDVRALHLPGLMPGGLPDESFLHCDNMNGNPTAIEKCGISLGNLANKLPPC